MNKEVRWVADAADGEQSDDVLQSLRSGDGGRGGS